MGRVSQRRPIADERMYDDPRTFTLDELDRLKRIAASADSGGRRWQASGGYPQSISRLGDAVLIAQTFVDPDSPSTEAEFIAAFDPPTVRRLLEEVVPHH